MDQNGYNEVDFRITDARLTFSPQHSGRIVCVTMDDDNTTACNGILSEPSLAPNPYHATCVHTRLSPVTNPLSSFRSQREFLCGFISALEIHERLVAEQGILHRYIHPCNIVFNGSGCGDRQISIIDADYAALDGTGSTLVRPLPFLSLAILRQISEDEDITCEVADDLESLFYVFIWVCVHHTGPNGVPSHTTIAHQWVKRPMLYGSLTYALNAKSSFIYAPNRSIENQFASYFENLKPLGEEWKNLVKAEDERRYKPDNSASSSNSLHRTIINRLQSYVNNLPLVDP